MVTAACRENSRRNGDAPLRSALQRRGAAPPGNAWAPQRAVQHGLGNGNVPHSKAGATPRVTLQRACTAARGSEMHGPGIALLRSAPARHRMVEPRPAPRRRCSAEPLIATALRCQAQHGNGPALSSTAEQRQRQATLLSATARPSSAMHSDGYARRDNPTPRQCTTPRRRDKAPHSNALARPGFALLGIGHVRRRRALHQHSISNQAKQ
jgi:hypothetical protein